MPRTWKSALAPYLAGIPARTGFFGEARFGLLNDLRWGERRLPRMIDRCAVLALPQGRAAAAANGRDLSCACRPPRWRLGASGWGLRPTAEPSWPSRRARSAPSKRWPAGYYAELARRLAAAGSTVWVIGGPGEQELAAEIAGSDKTHIRDLTGPDLRNAILALAAADVAISNDSGLLHVAAALGTPAIGIFGPTSPWHWAPLNPLAAVIETASELPCRPCHKPVCRLGHHRCMRDIPVDQVAAAVRSALAAAPRRLSAFTCQTALANVSPPADQSRAGAAYPCSHCPNDGDVERRDGAGCCSRVKTRVATR